MQRTDAQAVQYGNLNHVFNQYCPWTQQPIAADSLAQYQGVIIGFSCPQNRDKFVAAPQQHADVLALVAQAHDAMHKGTYQPPIRWFGRRIGARFDQQEQLMIDDILPKFQIDMDAGETLDLQSIFGEKPIWLEIGFGGGEHLFEQAKNNPNIGFIGCEPFLTGVASLLKKIHSENIQNIRIWPDDARMLIHALPESSIQKAFVLFADPWPKRRHNRRRFITSENLSLLSPILENDAQLIFGSDHTDYIPWAVGQILEHPNFSWCAQKPEDWLNEPAQHVKTRYQTKAENKGDICRFIIVKHHK